MNIDTVKSLAASKGYQDRKWDTGIYVVGTDTLTQAIYGTSIDGRADQADDFLESENVRLYELNVRKDSDTLVGLWMVEVAGEPVGVMWRPNRKSDQSMSFLSVETRAAVIAKWDRYADNTPQDPSIMSEAELSIPVAPADADTPFDLYAWNTPYLDIAGAEKVADRLKAGDTTDDLVLLNTVQEVLNKAIEGHHVRIQDMLNMKSLPASHLSDVERTRTRASIDEQIALRRERITTLQDEMIPLVSGRISALTDAPAP